MPKKCKSLLENDVDSYTKEQYAEMEKDLAEKINQVIEEIENKYCIYPTLEITESKNRLKPTDIFIFNKSVHNIFPLGDS